MKKTIKKLGKSLAIQIVAFSILIGGVAFATITFPTSTPAGQTAGGKFQGYFDKIFNSLDFSGTNTTVKGSLKIGTTTTSSQKIATDGNISINNTSPTIYMTDKDHRPTILHTNSNKFYILRGSGANLEKWQSTGGLWPLEINLENNNASFGGNVGIGNNNPGASLDVSGKTIKLSNLYPEYNWAFGGGKDLNWKKIADVKMGTETYSAMSMKVSIIDAMSNHGHSENMKPIDFYISARRSGASLNDRNNGAVSGPISDYVRLVKTSLGNYEVQVRSVANYRHIKLNAQVISANQTTITYATSPVNGSTNGDIYMPLAYNVDNFSNLYITGTTKTNKLQLGDKYILSGVGDKHANDDWIRMAYVPNQNKNDNTLYGPTGGSAGIAAANLWARDNIYAGNNIQINGADVATKDYVDTKISEKPSEAPNGESLETTIIKQLETINGYTPVNKNFDEDTSNLVSKHGASNPGGDTCNGNNTDKYVCGVSDVKDCIDVIYTTYEFCTGNDYNGFQCSDYPDYQKHRVNCSKATILQKLEKPTDSSKTATVSASITGRDYSGTKEGCSVTIALPGCAINNLHMGLGSEGSDGECIDKAVSLVKSGAWCGNTYAAVLDASWTGGSSGNFYIKYLPK